MSIINNKNGIPAMSFNSALDAEMRKYQHEQMTSNVACSLTPRQLHTPIEQNENPQIRKRRSTDKTKAKKPPIFLRKWFLGLMIMLFSGLYALQAGYVRAVRNIGDNVKTATGIDILSVDTYKKLAKPPDEKPVENFRAAVEATTQTTPDTPIKARDYSVNQEALGNDMSKIQEEAEKLNTMAREFDEQFRPNK